MLVEPQGETGVEGGVNGLNPGVGFLSQALWMVRHEVSEPERENMLSRDCCHAI